MIISIQELCLRQVLVKSDRYKDDPRIQHICQVFLDANPQLKEFAPRLEVGSVERMAQIYRGIMSSIEGDDVDHLPMVEIVQKIKDKNLVLLFDRLCQYIGARTPRPSREAGAIRTWMAKNPAVFNRIIEFDLEGSALTFCPIEINLFRDLRTLKLSNSRILFFPEGLNLPQLQTLQSMRTRVRAFPETVQLPRLEVLDLQSTRFTALPTGIDLRRLYMLDLRGTQAPEKQRRVHAFR